MCVQFSGIDTSGTTEVAAVNEVLDTLMHYLYDWHESNGKGRPTRKVDQIYRDAFDFGNTPSDILKQLRESLHAGQSWCDATRASRMLAC